MAFLTPFPNTLGFTVLVPRVREPSDIFSLDSTSYTSMLQAAYTVAQVLKETSEIQRCGMIFERLEMNYAHIRLIPIHDDSRRSAKERSAQTFVQSAFHKTYTGHETSSEVTHCNNVNQLS